MISSHQIISNDTQITSQKNLKYYLYQNEHLVVFSFGLETSLAFVNSSEYKAFFVGEGLRLVGAMLV